MKLSTPIAFVAAALFVTSARAAYVTGFESPTFTSGPITGQDGWTTASGPASTARVLTASEIETELTNTGLNPGVAVHGGSQALVVSGAGPSSGSATIRVIDGFAGENDALLDFWARPLMPGTTGEAIGNVFVTMEDAAGVRAAAVRFGPSFIDYGTNVGGIWASSGTAWAEDTWYRLTLDVDYATRTYDFFIDGAQVNVEPIPFYNNTTPAGFAQVRLFRGSNQAGMIVDDVTVVPEPGAMALMLGAGALLLRRRVG